MNKAILLIFACILATSLVLAAGPGSGSGQGTGQGLQTTTEQETQNEGDLSNLQVQSQLRQKVQSGEHINEEGEQMQIREENGIRLKVKDVEAHSLLNMTQERIQNKTRLNVQLSNGRNAEIKIMPDTASETAIARLRLKVCNETNNCTIQLKETGQGNQTKATYEIQAQKQIMVFGLFKARMQVQAQVDAENGEVIQAKKPWWSFLASEA